MNKLIAGLLLVLVILCIAHVINYIITKGVIWVALELFNVDWRGKFWVVYIALILVSTIIRGFFPKNTK